MAPDTPSPDLGPIGTSSSGDVLLKDHFRAKIPTLPTAAMFLGSQPLKSPHFGLESPVSLNGFFGEHDPFQGLRVRPRNTSECSTDIEPLSDGQLQSDAQTNNSLRPTMKKRPSADGVDYPRRRATIAVSICPCQSKRDSKLTMCSARYVVHESLVAMGQGQNADCAPSLTQSASIANQVSSLTRATSSFLSVSTALSPF